MPSLIKARKFVSIVAGTAMTAALSPAFAAMMEDTVATVNGQPILLSEYNKELNVVLENWKRSAPGLFNDKAAVAELKRKVLDQMVDNSLLEQEAEKRKIKIHDRELENGVTEVKEKNFRRDENGKMLTDKEVEQALVDELKKEGVSQEQFRQRILKQLMMRRVIEEVVRPKVKTPDEADGKAAWEKLQFIVKGDTSAIAGMSDEEGQAYMAFGQRIKDATSERVRVSHILIKLSPKASEQEQKQAADRAKDLKKRIEGGEDFADVARKYSDDTESAARGGDLGQVIRGIMPPDFEKAAFGLAVGDVSDPVKTDFGYHLIRVTAHLAAEKVAFEKVKDDVLQFLFQLRSQLELDKFVKSLRTSGHIEVNLPKDKDAKEPSSKNN